MLSILIRNVYLGLLLCSTLKITNNFPTSNKTEIKLETLVIVSHPQVLVTLKKKGLAGRRFLVIWLIILGSK